MNVNDAIKLIRANIKDEKVEWDSPLGRAYKLSFEALKRVRDQRKFKLSKHVKLLPWETEE